MATNRNAMTCLHSLAKHSYTRKWVENVLPFGKTLDSCDSFIPRYGTHFSFCISIASPSIRAQAISELERMAASVERLGHGDDGNDSRRGIVGEAYSSAQPSDFLFGPYPYLVRKFGKFSFV